MNKLRKVTFGILVGGLAFGFSAFTTIKKSSVLTYYKVNMSYPSANDYHGYVYYSDDRCVSGGSLCKATWNIGLNALPQDGDPLPSTGITFISGSAYSGHFE